jgi:PBSX family phage portal protein
VGKNTERTRIGKATVVGSRVQDSTVERLRALIQGTNRVAAIGGTLEPPFPPESLQASFERSSVLRQCIEALVTNVEGFGHKLEPSINLDAPDADEKIRDAMHFDRVTSGGLLSNTPVPTDEEVARKKIELRQLSKFELNQLRTFFAAFCPDMSFLELRARTRQETETIGNGYWEILRDKAGRVSRAVLAPGLLMRLCAVEKEPVEVQEPVQSSAISWSKVPQAHYFRKYAEIDPAVNQVRAYFKEFGDPRLYSRKTGKRFETPEEVAAALAKGDGLATEILHFRIWSPRTPYGIPRWIGNLPAVLGSRELDEVNLSYFESKTVPPLALLVSGGRLAKGIVPRLEEFIEQNVKGKKNFHKILVIEAEGQKSAAGTSGVTPSLKFVPLREAQQQDALFQKYDEANLEKIASCFRLPRFLIGRDRLINRASAFAALRFAEEQVFEPLRNNFDAVVNRHIFPALGITFWRFRSNTPITRDPEVLASILGLLTKGGTLTPAESREFASDVFNRELPDINEDWTKQPLALTIAELRVDQGLPPEPEEPAALPGLPAPGEPPEDDDVDGDVTVSPEGNPVLSRAPNGDGSIEMPALPDK